MKALLEAMLLVGIISCWPASSWAATSQQEEGERNYFQFAIPKYHTKRQLGQIVDIYVRYAYTEKLDIKKYPDYRLLRTAVLAYMQPSPKLPMNLYWEIIATKMGKKLMADFPLAGVSIQLNVRDKQNSKNDDPGDHGPIFTMGKIAPLDIH